jgi:hypothetical protein
MAEYRLHWLLAGIACSVLAPCILVTALIIGATPYNCTEEITESIGKFDSKEAGMRGAIPNLAAEIARCPDAKVYRITCVGAGNQAWDTRHGVVYDRRNKKIGYEDDLHSSFSDETYVVDDRAIVAVAEEGGRLEEFGQYDQRGR